APQGNCPAMREYSNLHYPGFRQATTRRLRHPISMAWRRHICVVRQGRHVRVGDKGRTGAVARPPTSRRVHGSTSPGTIIAVLTLHALWEITPDMNDVTRRYIVECRYGTVDLQAKSVADLLPPTYAQSYGTFLLPRPLFVNYSEVSGFAA